MTAKENGGHAVYKVLRLVGRLEEWSSTHQGDAGQRSFLKWYSLRVL